MQEGATKQSQLSRSNSHNSKNLVVNLNISLVEKARYASSVGTGCVVTLLWQIIYSTRIKRSKTRPFSIHHSPFTIRNKSCGHKNPLYL